MEIKINNKPNVKKIEDGFCVAYLITKEENKVVFAPTMSEALKEWFLKYASGGG